MVFVPVGLKKRGYPSLPMPSSDERPTLRVIAERADTSIMTVSRVLRGVPHVSPELRRRILKIVEEVGYRPDPTLSALNAYRTNKRHQAKGDVLVYLTNWKTEFGWRRYRQLEELYDGVKARAVELGYRMEHIWLGAPGFRNRASEILYARGVEGIILSPIQANLGYLDLKWDLFTTVVIGYSVLTPRTHIVVSDYHQGVALAWKKLRRLGYRRIGLAIPRRHEVRTQSRWSSAVLKLQERLPQRERIPALLDMEVNHEQKISKAGFPEFKKWLLKHKPDAVLGMGSGMPEWIRELGFAVPEEVAYANLDLESSDENSGIYQHPELVGSAAVSLLQMRLHHFEKGIPKNPHAILIAPTWIDGATAAKVRKVRGAVKKSG